MSYKLLAAIAVSAWPMYIANTIEPGNSQRHLSSRP